MLCPWMSPARVIARAHALVQPHHEVCDHDDRQNEKRDGDEGFLLGLGIESVEGRFSHVWWQRLAPCILQHNIQRARWNKQRVRNRDKLKRSHSYITTTLAASSNFAFCLQRQTAISKMQTTQLYLFFSQLWMLCTCFASPLGSSFSLWPCKYDSGCLTLTGPCSKGWRSLITVSALTLADRWMDGRILTYLSTRRQHTDY